MPTGICDLGLLVGAGLDPIILVIEVHVHAFDGIAVIVDHPDIPIGTTQARNWHEQYTCNSKRQE